MKVFKIVTTTRKDIQNKECELKETTCKKKKITKTKQRKIMQNTDAYLPGLPKSISYRAKLVYAIAGLKKCLCFWE